MPDIRYPLRNGDRTSTNGVLIATGRNWFHHDVVVGVEGDHATCPACNVGGPVMNDCFPTIEIDGKRILVSGARVYCRCPIKPMVLPSQTNFTVEVSGIGAGHVPTESASIDSAGRSQAACGVNAEVVEQYFEITTDAGQPAEGYRYDLFENGELVVKNKEMAGGRTLSVAAGSKLRIVMWLDKRGQEGA